MVAMKRAMGRKRWQALREDIADTFKGALDGIKDLDSATFSEKREAAEEARDVVLASLYEADAIEPPAGIIP